MKPSTPGPAAAYAVLVALAAILALACVPEPAPGILPEADFRPPALLEAGALDESRYRLLFDEELRAPAEAFALDPGGAAPCAAGSAAGEVIVTFPLPQLPGASYALAGEVEDLRGNRTRLILEFAGYNGRPALLRLAELQAAKNSSVLKPHRDFLEFEVLAAGNLGGLELSWASSSRSYSYRFPGAEVATGERVVLHLAPEGLAEERDELGAELGASGGVDSSPTGRDLWSGAGGLPDENGILALRERAAGPLLEAFFYAREDKGGALGQDRLGDLAAVLAAEAAWPFAAGEPTWEDAFRWKPSVSRSICRLSPARGRDSWYLSASGAQSPGEANPPPP